ncbi:MAG TPA: hypothetical protein P5216_04315, partial [Bacteroidota bacterium]|nr:hypothetical protein [Bacteroidota bacterium]
RNISRPELMSLIFLIYPLFYFFIKNLTSHIHIFSIIVETPYMVSLRVHCFVYTRGIKPSVAFICHSEPSEKSIARLDRFLFAQE